MLNLCRREHGQDIVEYALIFPVFILLVLGIMEFGILFFNYNTLANAAREGARAGIVPATSACNQACVDAKVLAATNALTTGLNPLALSIAITHPSAGIVKVAVTYNTNLITGPMIAAVGGSGAISLQSVATMRIE